MEEETYEEAGDGVWRGEAETRDREVRERVRKSSALQVDSIISQCVHFLLLRFPLAPAFSRQLSSFVSNFYLRFALSSGSLKAGDINGCLCNHTFLLTAPRFSSCSSSLKRPS